MPPTHGRTATAAIASIATSQPIHVLLAPCSARCNGKSVNIQKPIPSTKCDAETTKKRGV